MTFHSPLYPTRSTLRHESRATALFIAQAGINARIKTILDRARTEIATLDLSGHSMIDGYDLAEIPAILREITPAPECPVRTQALEDWASAEASDVGGV